MEMVLINGLTIGTGYHKMQIHQMVYSNYEDNQYWFSVHSDYREYINLEVAGQSLTDWTGGHVWNIELTSTNPYFQSDESFTEYVYRIWSSTEDTELGSKLRINEDYPDHYGYPPNEPQRFLKIVGDEVYIFCMKEDANYDNVLHFLSGAGNWWVDADPNFPNVLTDVQAREWASPRWYPVDGDNYLNDPEALWTLTFM
jgi:hypothetical protein